MTQQAEPLSAAAKSHALKEYAYEGSGCPPLPPEETDVYLSFVAGAAWQRERDRAELQRLQRILGLLRDGDDKVKEAAIMAWHLGAAKALNAALSAAEIQADREKL